MRKILTALALASMTSGLALTAYAQEQRPGTQEPRTPAAPDRNQNVRPQPPGTTTPRAAPGSPSTTAPGTQADSAFVTQALKSGKEEVALAQMAVDKSQNPRIKDFAQMLVRDHSAVNDRLAQVSGQAPSDKSGTDRSLRAPGTGPNRGDQPPATSPGAAPSTPAMQRLSNLQGEAFDKAWLAQIVAGHQKSVALYQRESQRGTDPATKALAAETLPKIKAHLAIAQSLQKAKPSR